MKFKHSILAAAVLSSAFAIGAAQAQTGTGATGPSTAGGQQSTPNQDKGSTPQPSMTSRAEVKAEAAAAKAAASVPQGQQSTPNQGKKPAKAKAGEKTRGEVKAEVGASHVPKGGQESVKDQNKGGNAAARP